MYDLLLTLSLGGRIWILPHPSLVQKIVISSMEHSWRICSKESKSWPSDQSTQALVLTTQLTEHYYWYCPPTGEEAPYTYVHMYTAVCSRIHAYFCKASFSHHIIKHWIEYERTKRTSFLQSNPLFSFFRSHKSSVSLAPVGVMIGEYVGHGPAI